MNWSPRVMKLAPKDSPYATDEYVICEAYYDGEDIVGWGLGANGEGQAPFGETLEELREYIGWMMEACDKGVLDEEELLELCAREQITETTESSDHSTWVDDEFLGDVRYIYDEEE